MADTCNNFNLVQSLNDGQNSKNGKKTLFSVFISYREGVRHQKTPFFNSLNLVNFCSHLPIVQTSSRSD